MTSVWTRPEDIAARVRRRYADGSLLRRYAAGETFQVIDLPIKGPKATEIGDNLDAVRDWIARLVAGGQQDRRYTLQWASIGGRQIGRNEIPARAVLSSYEQVWTLLGVGDAVRQFDDVLSMTADHRAVQRWAATNPHKAIELRDAMPQLIAAYGWLDAQRGSGLFLRQIEAPGVDTKFAERHRAALAGMLGVSTTSSGFLAGLGLRAKPEFVRLRPAASLGLPSAMSEVAMRVDDLPELRIRPRRALVVENEITYLSVDVPVDGVVVWGKGFDVDRVGRLPWLRDVDVIYWGDIDTHGFAILDRLRAWLPQTRSILMDRATLTEHGERWVLEDRPTTATLTRLTPAEHDLYVDLVTDRLGDRVRLEQERVDWSWARTRLADLPRSTA